MVVLTNEDSASAFRAIWLEEIAALLFRDTDAARQEEQAREIFAGLQRGKNRPRVADRQLQQLFYRAGAQGFWR